MLMLHEVAHDTVPWQWPRQELLQISDCHLLADKNAVYQGVQPYRHLQRLLATWQSTPLPLVLTGDLTEDHSPQSYQLLGDLLSNWPAPVYLVPGNHDDVSVMVAQLNKPPFVLASRVELAHWQLLLLDSRSTSPAGAFDGPRLQLLQRHLQQANIRAQHVWLFCHHQPKAIGSFIDRFGQQDSEAFCALLQANSHVRGLSHGHCHLGYVQQQQHWHIVGCPASSVQFLQTADWQTENQGPQAVHYQFHADGSVIINFHRENADAVVA